ncbi:MAG: methionine/alanine import family NSS transporter small subunit [Bacilli bacterium]
MSADAIVMMIFCMILIWGGFIGAILYSSKER